MIYLDNSATTYPKPPQVIRAVHEASSRYGFNPGRGGYRQSLKTAEKIYNVRTKAKEFFGVYDETGVIFTSGCTDALNTVIKGVLHKGDHVVISSLEHNAVVRPLYRLKEQGIITYSVAESGKNDEETLQKFREKINSHTRLMICTHASNVFGTRLPVERLCALAHSNGILFCLDAAQSAGIFDIDLSRDGYDFVCCAGHKYLYGPMGIGLLLLGNDRIIDTLREGGTGSESSSFEMPRYYPDRMEAGTLNVPGIIGLGAGLSFVSRRGIDRIYRSESAWIRQLYRQLSSITSIKLYTEESKLDRNAPVLSFTVNGKDSEEIARILGESYDISVRGGLHCAPLAHQTMETSETGTVRIAPSIFSTENDRLLLVNSLRKIR